MAEPSNPGRGAARTRARSTWVRALPTRRAFWFAGALVCLLLLVGNAAEAHWWGVLWAAVSASICARRAWGHGAADRRG